MTGVFMFISQHRDIDRGELHVKTQTETGMIHLQVKEHCWRPHEARRKAWNGFSPRAPRKNQPCHPWFPISGLLNWEKILFYWFKTLSLWHFVTAAVRNTSTFQGCYEGSLRDSMGKRLASWLRYDKPSPKQVTLAFSSGGRPTTGFFRPFRGKWPHGISAF